MKIRTILERILHIGGYGCSDTERLLFDFIEGDLATEVAAKLEKHLADCPSCQDFVSSYRNTIHATHDYALPEIEMPLQLEKRLREFIEQNPALR